MSLPSTTSRYTDADLLSHSAQDALSAANCLANPTIETLQSLIFMAQHLMPNLGMQVILSYSALKWDSLE